MRRDRVAATGTGGLAAAVLAARRAPLISIALLVLALMPGAIARSHPLAPGLLELVETDAGRYAVSWRTSRFRTPGVELAVVLPERCRALGTVARQSDAQSTTERWSVDCGASGLTGARVGVAGLAESRIDALLRVELLDGRRHQTVLRPSRPTWRVPERAQPLDVLSGYGRLGAGHIAFGPDHLLFVLGLILLVAEPRALLWTVTAFTLGHSATLSIAALGFVHFPAAWIELSIAASVLALAVELARGPERGHWMRRQPWIMAGGFGLLHGLGFAGALAEIGLPPEEIPLALFSFNVGIEIGQLGFVACVLAARAIYSRTALSSVRFRWLARVPSYTIGVLASYWCFERAAALL